MKDFTGIIHFNLKLTDSGPIDYYGVFLLVTENEKCHGLEFEPEKDCNLNCTILHGAGQFDNALYYSCMVLIGYCADLLGVGLTSYMVMKFIVNSSSF